MSPTRQSRACTVVRGMSGRGGTPPVAVETEWQFDALDLSVVARWLADPAGWAGVGAVEVSPRDTVSHVDLYLDTEDRRFHRAGYALRVRRVGRRRAAEATLKSLDPVSAVEPGLRRRREVSEPLEQSDPALLRQAGGPVGERVRVVAGRKRLVSLFEARTRRQVFALHTDGGASGEAVLDETSIHWTSGVPARLLRVEIEVPEPAASMFGPFVDRLRTACGLQPAGMSKYEAGLLIVGLQQPPAESIGPTQVSPDAPIGEVALAVVRQQFAVLLAKEAGARLGDDIEELHEMRVASRRLRAALSLFADVLPAGVIALQGDLSWLGRVLGAVRDVDVELEQLDNSMATASQARADALAALRPLLEEQRRSSRSVMLEALDSSRYTSFVRRFRRTLRAQHARRSGPASLPARAVAPDLIEARFRRFRKRADRIGPDSPASAYHRLRIDTKRLRYSLEFFAGLYPDRTQRLIRRLVALQDVLGLHQDADISGRRLRRLAVEHGTELPADTIFAMGEIAEHDRQSMIELRSQFPAAYARTRGKVWTSFRKQIEARRPIVAASVPSGRVHGPATESESCA